MFRIKPARESLRVLTWNEKGEVVGLTEAGRKVLFLVGPDVIAGLEELLKKGGTRALPGLRRIGGEVCRR